MLLFSFFFIVAFWKKTSRLHRLEQTNDPEKASKQALITPDLHTARTERMGPYYDENERPWPWEKEPPSTDETDSEEEKESTREKKPALHIFQINDASPRCGENIVNMCKIFRNPRKGMS